MATRRDAREWAVQMLYRLDMNPVELEALLDSFWEETAAEPAARRFAEELVRGVQAHRAEIDRHIVAISRNWSLARMAVLDRNVIRMALFEILYRDDIPCVVSINEAVDIAKRFNSSESGRFVNGILDRALRELDAGTPHDGNG